VRACETSRENKKGDLSAEIRRGSLLVGFNMDVTWGLKCREPRNDVLLPCARSQSGAPIGVLRRRGLEDADLHEQVAYRMRLALSDGGVYDHWPGGDLEPLSDGPRQRYRRAPRHRDGRGQSGRCPPGTPRRNPVPRVPAAPARRLLGGGAVSARQRGICPVRCRHAEACRHRAADSPAEMAVPGVRLGSARFVPVRAAHYPRSAVRANP
jgi:hypothetical protein